MDESSHALSFHCPFCDNLRVLIFVLTIRSVYLGAYFYFTKHFESTVFCFLFYFYYFFKVYFIFKLYNIVLVLPNIEMNPPQVYMCSPS